MPEPALVRQHGRWIVAAAPAERVEGRDCLATLNRPVLANRAADAMADGWIGLFSYDAATFIERLPDPLPDPGGPPIATLARYPAVFAVNDDGTWSIEAVSPRATARLLDGVDPSASWPTPPAGLRGPMPTSSLSPSEHRRAVDEAREFIRAGDCYQVNLAMRLTAAWSRGGPALASGIWDAAGPAAYRAYLALPDGVLISASPERLVRTEPGATGPSAVSGPIKGTALPGKYEELQRSTKNRAEHVMIVDLIRNDLGRVSVPGGVSVPRLTYRLSTDYAEHMVSDVRAELRPGVSAGHILTALLPGGSVTGCPKIRSMEIIRSLEPVSRGPAFGSVVAVGRDGSLDANILIRTAWLRGEVARYWCGGAVVWDSDPDEEHAEAWLKAFPFLKAIGAA